MARGEPDQLKVSVRQSDDGRKKKIHIKNDFLSIKIRVKDQQVDFDCNDHSEDRSEGRRPGWPE